MDRRIWRAKAQGGYTRVIEVVNGTERSPEISVNKKVFGEQIARKLNDAYAMGVADSEADHARDTKVRVADLLAEMGYDQAAEVVRSTPL
jgi:hypothetical protein